MYHGKPYMEKKVYKAGGTLFLSRGAALSGGLIFDEGRLLYSKEQEPLLEGKGAAAYRFKDGDTASSWFLDRADVMASPAAKEYAANNPGAGLAAKVQKIVLDNTEVEPVTFPIYARVDYSKGRLCARVNLHPERDGPNNKGMFCFIDRNVPYPAPGIIRIESAVDKGNYAFISGEMVPYGMVDEEKFLDFVWDSGIIGECGNEPVYMVDHPSLGKFLCTEEYVWIETATSLYAEKTGSDYQKAAFSLTSGVREYIVRSTTLQEMILENSFGEKELDNILSSFTACEKFDQVPDGTLEGNKEQAPPVVRAGIDEGLISYLMLPDRGIEFMTLNTDHLYKLCGFNDNEIAGMAAEFTRINKMVDEMI